MRGGVKKTKAIEVKKGIEKDNITIIKNNNSEGTDANLINECLKKHFFMRAVDNKTR